MFINLTKGSKGIHSITSAMPDQDKFHSINYPNLLPLPILEVSTHSKVPVLDSQDKPLYTNYEGVETTEEYATLPYTGQTMQGAKIEWEGDKQVLKLPNEPIMRSYREKGFKEIKSGLVVDVEKILREKYLGLLTIYNLANDTLFNDPTCWGGKTFYIKWKDIIGIENFAEDPSTYNDKLNFGADRITLLRKESYAEWVIDLPERTPEFYKVYAEISRKGKAYTCRIQINETIGSKYTSDMKEVIDGEVNSLGEVDRPSQLGVRFTNDFDEPEMIHGFHIVTGSDRK